MGSKRLGLSILRLLHETEPQHLAGAILCDDRSDRRSSLPGFIEFAKSCDIDCRIAATRQEAKRHLIDLAPDIALASGWYTLFDDETIDLLPFGILGIHNSLLPTYRGGSPLVWAIMNGETRVGASLFRMTHGMDDGPVLMRFPVEVGIDDTIADVLNALEQAILAGLPEIWRNVINGTAKWQDQDHSSATYCGLRLPSDGLIDWTRSARDVHNSVRAQAPPYPCAYTRDGKRTIKIARTSLVAETWFGVPGQVLSISEGGVLVACGDRSAVRVFEVLNGNGEVVPAGSALKSIKTRLR
jgi:methionyl-tRNA formyltransferase